MKKFQEKHMKISHQDKKLDAVFIHQPTGDEKQEQAYDNFIVEMKGMLQKFLEKSEYFNNSCNKPNNYDKHKNDKKEKKNNLEDLDLQE